MFYTLYTYYLYIYLDISLGTMCIRCIEVNGYGVYIVQTVQRLAKKPAKTPQKQGLVIKKQEKRDDGENRWNPANMKVSPYADVEEEQR